MTGPGKLLSANEDVYNTLSNNENFVLATYLNSNIGTTHFSDQSGIGNFGQSRSFKKTDVFHGAVFLGNIGFQLQIVALDFNTSTINLLKDPTTPIVNISTDKFVILTNTAGTVADLVFIKGSQRPGQRLRLYNTLTNTITVKHTKDAVSDTIRTPDENDLIFPGNAVLDLTLDITTDQWRVVGNLGSSGTAGLSEPIILGINTLSPQTSPTVTPIAWDTKNPQHITIDRNVTFSFASLPASGKYEGVLVIIDIDSTGGYDTPIWPASVLNPPKVPTTANTRTSVMLYTIDGGIVVTHATSVGSSAGGNFANTSLSNLSNTSLNTDLNFGTFDGVDIDRLLFSQTVGSSLTLSQTGITSDGTGNMVFNIPNNTSYNLFSNNLSILSLSNSTSNLSLSLFARDDEIPILQLTRIDSTPTIGTEVGRTSFVGVDSTGSTQEEFGRIQVDTEDLTIGSVDGSMHLQVDKASVTTSFISLNNSNDNRVSIFKNLFMQTGIEIELNSNRLYTTTTANDTFLEGASASLGVFVSDNSSAKATFGSTRLILANDYFLQPQAIELRNVVADLSSPLDGTLWYNSTLNKFRGRENGATVDVIGGGEVFVWTANHDANGNLLILDPDGDSSISSASDDNILLTTGGSVRMNVDNVGVLIPSGTLNAQGDVILGDSSADTLSVNAWIGTSLIANSNLRDLGAVSQEWRDLFLDGTAHIDTLDVDVSSSFTGDATFDDDIIIDNGSRIRSNDSTEIGYFVTNATSSIGTAGTNQVPVVPSIGSPSNSTFNSAFGSEIGCMGVYNTSSSFKNIAIKVLSGTWLVLACPDSGGNVISDFIT